MRKDRVPVALAEVWGWKESAYEEVKALGLDAAIRASRPAKAF